MKAAGAIGRRELSVRDHAIIQSVGACRLIQATQLERIHFINDVALRTTKQRECRKVLHDLTYSGHLRRLERQIGGVRAGSSSYVYGLGPLGARLLLGKRPHRFLTRPSLYFLEHTLCQAELYTKLHEVNKSHLAEILQIQMEPHCWRTFYSLEHGLSPLKPDMYVWLQTGTDRLSWFIEIDRGTTYMHALRQKLALYVQYYLAGLEQKEHGVFPRVLWVAPNKARCQFIEKAIQPINERVSGLCKTTTDHAAIRVITENQEL